MVALYSEAEDETIDAIALALSKSGGRAHADFAEPRPRNVEWIQTHISHVFLVGDRVLKLRKAVAMPFLDFRTREARNEDCIRELALNRRLAPDVYLGVAPLSWDGESIEVGVLSESIMKPELEHVVVMQRLPAGGDALALLGEDRLKPDHLRAVAERLSEFHATHSLGQPAPWSPDEWIDRIVQPSLGKHVRHRFHRNPPIAGFRVTRLDSSRTNREPPPRIRASKAAR